MVDSRLARASEAFRALILPRRCCFCLGPTRSGQLCPGCRDALPRNDIACPVCALPQKIGPAHVCASCSLKSPAFDLAWSAFRYEAPVDQAIHGLKYHAQFRHSRMLAEAMAQGLSARSENLPTLLLPMPLHASRLRQRGYNQAMELARALSRHLKIEVDAQCATRIRVTEDQIGKNAVERRRNVKGAFAVNGDVRDLHVAIIDDVMTTGSTVSELARVCRAAGAIRIEVWTAARAV